MANFKLTADRLLELGGSLQGIMDELQASVRPKNPQKRKNKTSKIKNTAYYMNRIDAIHAKQQLKNKSTE